MRPYHPKHQIAPALEKYTPHYPYDAQLKVTAKHHSTFVTTANTTQVASIIIMLIRRYTPSDLNWNECEHGCELETNEPEINYRFRNINELLSNPRLHHGRP